MISERERKEVLTFIGFGGFEDAEDASRHVLVILHAFVLLDLNTGHFSDCLRIRVH